MSGGNSCVDVKEARAAICRPRPESSICDELIRDLLELGIECYLPLGRVRVGRLRLLGSGWAGNVFAAVYAGRIVAVKVLKPGSRRATLLREAILQDFASLYGISPRIYACTPRVIIMELVRGPTLRDYRASSRIEALAVARRLLYKAYLLDRLGIDHGELARPGGQVVLDASSPCYPEPYILDFDSASARRRPHNLTALAAGLHRIPAFRGIVKASSDPKVRSVLKAYRRNPCLEAFEAVLAALGLQV